MKTEKEIKHLETISNLYHELFHEWNEDHEDGCNSWGHTENCKAINIGEAKKAMRIQIEEANEILSHIIAMGHLTPGGSTEGWVNQYFKKYGVE